MHNDPFIKLEDMEIPVMNEYKFWGVIFDRKLTFIPHIKYSKTKSTRSQKILRVVVHPEWGADRQTHLKLHRSLICSKLNYTIFINRSARRSYLKQIDPIHYEGLRHAFGNFITGELTAYMPRPMKHLYNSYV